jgi:hypothetical protein
MEEIAKFISTLFASRTQAHVFHLQTQSYAAHKALQKYYEDIVELVDTYVEASQGRYGIVKGYTLPGQIFEDDSVVKYFTGLLTYVDTVRAQLPQDGELNNTVDSISELISSTIYKLKFLK